MLPHQLSLEIKISQQAAPTSSCGVFATFLFSHLFSAAFLEVRKSTCYLYSGTTSLMPVHVASVLSIN